MRDDEVAALLDSDERLVVVEAPAGCGKTYQGANYAQREANRLPRGRILILTHTHAACGVFAAATRSSATTDIKTIDALITQIATAYHKTLGLPADPSAWARRETGGYAQLASHVARLIKAKPMIAEALAERFPVIIGDEHQDTSESQQDIILAVHEGGARLRIFGDPMQQIYKSPGRRGFEKDRARWEALTQRGTFAKLENPHRWDSGSPSLGKWVLQARENLKNGVPIDLTGQLPDGLRVLRAANRAPTRTGYQLNREQRRPLDAIVTNTENLLILTDQNETATTLRAFWNRRLPIWEGHTRDQLSSLVNAITQEDNTPESLGVALNEFVYGVSAGYTASTHGNRLVQEIRENCARRASNKPARLQEIARHILNNPNHKGVASALAQIEEFRSSGIAGFTEIKIDHHREFREAIRLGDYDEPEVALGEFHRRRSYVRPSPPAKAISTIHKAKGLECDHSVLLPCDGARYRDTDYARCKLYVALSRAQHSLTLVVCPNNPGPLFRL